MSDPGSGGRTKSKKMSAVTTSGASSPSAASQRKGASMVGLRLADMNQHLCTAMFGVVLGDPCHLTEKVWNRALSTNLSDVFFNY